MVGRGTPFPSICASQEHKQELFSSRKPDFGHGDFSTVDRRNITEWGYWMLPKAGGGGVGVEVGVEQKEPLTGGS